MDTAALVDGAVVRAAGLKKQYHGHPALDGIGLEVRRGELYGLIGPDGAGKSSLMKIVAGVLSFDAGLAQVFGVSLDSERAAERVKDRLGFMPQGLGLNLYPELSVEENIDYFARLRLVPDSALAARKEALLAMTRLTRFRDRAMKNLSGGMKQKLGLVCTLIHEPELVILDEPTTGVDPISRRDFWNILGQLLRERGITALVSTAYLDEASRFDRLALVYGGRILAAGTPSELTALVPAATPIEAGVPELEPVFVSLLEQRGLDEVTAEPRERATHEQAVSRNGVAVEARGLTRNFGTFRAVDNLSFEVRHGEIFGLVGANGAGKTTVIKMLTGLLRPSAGAGQVAGVDMRRAERDVRRRIGYVSQAFSLYGDLTVEENLSLSAGVYGLTAARARERIAWALGMGRLAGHEHDLAGSLPMGMRQRLALGCALLHQPHVLFLDEPTSGVDPLGRRRFWDILLHLAREEGVAILITTHYMSEAERCDRVGLMHAGRLVDAATPADMKRAVAIEAGQLLELEVDDANRALDRLRAAGLSDAALHGPRIHLYSHDVTRDSAHIATLLRSADARLMSIVPRPISLEDVFVQRIAALERSEAA
ncbi:MAG TPA: ATP-binding cassette domain-containing protein [Steroidobacteraceae bacterium]|nr:ATP-binding cassette domain-containing protein [Steroidobacteraceae bacterium]